MVLQRGLRNINTNIIGSPIRTSNFSYFIQAGSVLTNAGSVAFINLNNNYSTSNFYIAIQPRNNGSAFYVSGVTSVSGVNMVGAPSTRYDWIAVGGIQ